MFSILLRGGGLASVAVFGLEGCASQGTCEVSDRDVSDADDTIGFSAADVLVAGEGLTDLPAASADGTTTGVEVRITRGDGSSVLHDWEQVGGHPGLVTTLEGLDCADELVVPIEVEVSTGDGSFAASGALDLRVRAVGDVEFQGFATGGVDEGSGAIVPVGTEGSSGVLTLDIRSEGLARVYLCGEGTAVLAAPPGSAGCG